MHVIYEALKKTGGKTDGDSLVAAAKGLSFESPRGPFQIDPETRDIVQNIYIRQVRKVGGGSAQRRDRQGREGQGPGIGGQEVGDRCAHDRLQGQSVALGPIFGVLFDGFAYGMLLFLLSVGLSVTLGMMNFVNLAHCAFAMLGGYVTVTLSRTSTAGRSWRRCRWPSSPRRWRASPSSARSTGGSTAPASSIRCC